LLSMPLLLVDYARQRFGDDCTFQVNVQCKAQTRVWIYAVWVGNKLPRNSLVFWQMLLKKNR